MAVDQAPEANDAPAVVAAEAAPVATVVYDDPEDTVPWDDDAADQSGETAEFHPIAANEQPVEMSAAAPQPDDTSSTNEPTIGVPAPEAHAPVDIETDVASEASVEAIAAATPVAEVEAPAVAEVPDETEVPSFDEETAETVPEPVADDDVAYFEETAGDVRESR